MKKVFLLLALLMPLMASAQSKANGFNIQMYGDSIGNNPIIGDSIGNNPIIGDSIGNNPIVNDSIGNNPIVNDSTGNNPIVNDSTEVRIAINATNFPDANFRSWLLQQSYGSDGILTQTEIENIERIVLMSQNIRNLKGIEFFTQIELLNCVGNLIDSLDVSKNTALTNIQCSENNLKSLDVSNNTLLETLSCNNNQLTSLYLSRNTALQSLQCNNNKLTSLNVSNNTALTYLDCYSNQINGAAMDSLVGGLPVITSGSMWDGQMYVIYNQNEGNDMTVAQVSAAKAKGWTPKYYVSREEGWQEYAGSGPVPGPGPDSTSVAINATNFPDANFRSWLLEQSFGTDSVLTKTEIEGATDMIMSGRNIESLEGIGYFKELIYLYCDNNKLTTLDVSACTKLQALLCNQNNLTSLNVSGCSDLYWIYIYQNQIKGAAMDSLIDSMPIARNGQMFVIYCEDEGNVMTTAQAAAASAKGWVPAYNDGNAWRRYAGSEPDTLKCAQPVINYEDGKVTFSCETEDVEFHYNCYAIYRANGEGDEIEVSQQQYIRIDVYASKEGYEDSETKSAVISVGGAVGKKGDVNMDGIVNGTDIQEVINIIVNEE